MTERELGNLIVSHRGLPIGRTTLVGVELPSGLECVIIGFEPLPGYDSVRALVQRGSEAKEGLQFFGPIGDAESDRRNGEALGALKALLAELEFRDEVGRLVTVDVMDLNESVAGRNSYYALTGFVDKAASDVVARLSPPADRDAGHEPPAV